MAGSPRVSHSIGDAQVFNVELRPGETTIVSWKKLLREANKGGGSTSLNSPSAPGQPAENEVKDALGPHRFSAVVEKIERLYMGKHSSDEEDLNDYPDDDQYDTEDSFIDDAELDEYFEVDKSEIKHDGFFVNRGKLEHVEPTISPIQQMRKRRKKDLTKGLKENGDAHVSNHHSKLNKVSSGKAVLQKKTNAYNPSQSLVSNNEEPQYLKLVDQLNISEARSKTKSEAGITLDNSSPITVSNGYTSACHSEPKKIEKQKMRVLQPKNFSDKLKHANDPSEISHHKSHFSTPLPDNNSIPKYPLQATKILHAKMHKQDGSSIKPKSNMLERAIRELERTVAESRPLVVENQETDSSSQIVKRRLPTDIKLKLARVARSAMSHGKLSKDLVHRLMGILGHLMNLRTLKRNLKAIISMGVPVKQEKEDRFQQIKKEIMEMIKMRIDSFKPKASDKQAGKSYDLEVCCEGKGISKRKLSMGTALEDKFCDLYDLFVDGLDEDAGPQIRKLYAELAELWPDGIMDSHSIRRAICRAKERQKSLYNSNKDQEKKVLAIEAEEAIRVKSSSTIQPHEKLSASCNAHGLVSASKENSVSLVEMASHSEKPKLKATADRLSAAAVDARVSESDSTKKVKTKPGGVEATSDNSPAAIVSESDLTKKKMKRKPGPDATSDISPPAVDARVSESDSTKKRVKTKPGWVEATSDNSPAAIVSESDPRKKQMKRKPGPVATSDISPAAAGTRVSESDSRKKKVKTKPGGVEATSDNFPAAIVIESDPTKKKMKRKPEPEATSAISPATADAKVSESDSTKKKVKTKLGGVEATSDNSPAAIVSENDPTKKRMKRKPGIEATSDISPAADARVPEINPIRQRNK